MGHHYIPQRYLRNFQDPNRPGFIWVFDKRAGESSQASIRKVAQQVRYFDADIEVELAERVEKPANSVIAKLTRGFPPNAIERLNLAIYIAVMLKRVPYRRQKTLEMIPEVLESTIAEVRAQVSRILNDASVDENLVEERLSQIEAIHQKYLIEPPECVIRHIREPRPTLGMIGCINQMTWRILESSGPVYFITTDNPAFFFESYGLGTQDSELCFPLSTTHALHGCWQGSQAAILFLRATQAIVKEVNRRLASTTTRLAFYHEKVKWAQMLLRKNSPYLSRIIW